MTAAVYVLALSILIHGVLMSKSVDRITASLNGLFASLNGALVIVQAPVPSPSPDESAAIEALADSVDSAKSTVDAALAAHAAAVAAAGTPPDSPAPPAGAGA